MLQKHYKLLSKMSVNDVFDANWKEVEDSVSGYSNCSEEVTDALSYKEIEKNESVKCVGKLEINESTEVQTIGAMCIQQ